MSSSTKSSSSTSQLCLVCSGPSNGICHFGVHCCRACASFFHRSVKEKRKYNCRWGQKCQINNDDGLRNSCRACRLKKCLAVGMAEQKKRDRDKPNEIESCSPSCSSTTLSIGGINSNDDNPLNSLPNIMHFVDSIRQYHHALRALSVVEGFCTELAGDQTPRLINHDEYARMIKSSVLLIYSMICEHCPLLRNLPNNDKIKLLKLYHNQFLLVFQGYLTERANYDANGSVGMLLPGALIDKTRLGEHFFTDDMDAEQRQRLTSIVEWHFEFTIKHYRPLFITQHEFAAITGIIFWNTVQKVIPFICPHEESNARREALYGELYSLIVEQNGGGTGANSNTKNALSSPTAIQAAIRFGKILDLVNQLMLHTWEMEEMWTMGRIFVNFPDFWDGINLPS